MNEWEISLKYRNRDGIDVKWPEGIFENSEESYGL